MGHVDSEAIGRRIAEARARSGLTQADLGGATGLDRSAIAKIENGLRRLGALELARIAEATGESFEWFVTEPPPAIVSYRAGIDSPTTSAIDKLLETIAFDVELLQSLGELSVDEIHPVDQPTDRQAAERLAARARALIGLDAGEPVSDLVNPLADFGLFVFARDLGPDAPDAGTTLLRHGGVTVINSHRAVGRRRLALAHEFGHYLLADDYTVDWRIGAWTDSQRVERLIDAFARALLLPADSVRARWSDLRSRSSVRDAAVLVASEFRVDMTTLAARLSDLDLASGEDLARVRSTTTTRADIIEHNLVVAIDLEGTTVPRRYARAVLALYRAERISADRAVSLLHSTIDETELPTLPPVNENEIWKFVS
ncbi:helix-turn-helix domain-containing protein [Actinoplanes solisilvae]|uniref:helix-turn-helix domain-containing protein n=1 Tax=Actinoplanes solisilvae TaxID=2486853 RepID=UPI00196A7DE2|nr:XRE family transcriptional regulator [Actinoplanes solisilvae]